MSVTANFKSTCALKIVLFVRELFLEISAEFKIKQSIFWLAI